jgi:hypothetical protein
MRVVGDTPFNFKKIVLGKVHWTNSVEAVTSLGMTMTSVGLHTLNEATVGYGGVEAAHAPLI